MRRAGDRARVRHPPTPNLTLGRIDQERTRGFSPCVHTAA